MNMHLKLEHAEPSVDLYMGSVQYTYGMKAQKGQNFSFI
jgi:hypothetical protein